MLSQYSPNKSIDSLPEIPKSVVRTGIAVGEQENECAQIRVEVLKSQVGSYQENGHTKSSSTKIDSLGGSPVRERTPTVEHSCGTGSFEKLTSTATNEEDSDSDVEGDAINDTEAFRAANPPPTKKRVIAEKVLKPVPDDVEPFQDWICK